MLITTPNNKLDQIPDAPGVYRFTNESGELLYIGKAKSLRKRLPAYFEGREHGPHIRKMATQITAVELHLTKTELEALLLEQRLISQLKPKYNIIFRDDKTYSYIATTNHAFPQIKTFRGKRSEQNNVFGPYVDSKTAKAKIETIQKAFQIRTCDDATFSNRSRPCVLHQIKRCSAPCINATNEMIKQDYAKQVHNAQNFLKGKSISIIRDLTQEMLSYSKLMQFEDAAKIRDQIQSISPSTSHQNMESDETVDLDILAHSETTNTNELFIYEIRSGLISNIFHYTTNMHVDEADACESLVKQHYVKFTPPKTIISDSPLEYFKEAISLIGEKWQVAPIVRQATNAFEKSWMSDAKLNAQKSTSALHDVKTAENKTKELALYKVFPKLRKADQLRIECFDISHFQGESPVASCVVYDQHQMRNDEYRLFNITPENGGDDYASMKEALIRRYQTREQNELPDLIIIDGGHGQLSKAAEALDLINVSIPLLGIAKGTTRKLGHEELIPTWGDYPIALDKSHPALLLLSMIRDESHRFAITRNRKKVSAKRTESELLKIPGIGPSKRKALLLAFGSAKSVANASISQISLVDGIGTALAEKIKKHFQT